MTVLLPYGQPIGVMNLTARRSVQTKPKPFLPRLYRYKYYPIDCEEEEAIRQAEVCLDLLTDRMIQSGESEKAEIMGQSFDVLRKMRLSLLAMSATRTTMGYN